MLVLSQILGLNQSCPSVIDYRNILASKIIEDGHSVTEASRTSQIGGMLLGGLALGGLGAVVGGLSGKRTETKKISRIDFQITVNNTKSPIFVLNVLNREIEKGGKTYQFYMDKIVMWHERLKVMIHQADLEDSTHTVDSETN